MMFASSSHHLKRPLSLSSRGGCGSTSGFTTTLVVSLFVLLYQAAMVTAAVTATMDLNLISPPVPAPNESPIVIADTISGSTNGLSLSQGTCFSLATGMKCALPATGVNDTVQCQDALAELQITPGTAAFINGQPCYYKQSTPGPGTGGQDYHRGGSDNSVCSNCGPYTSATGPTGVTFDGINDYGIIDPAATTGGGPMTVEIVAKWSEFKNHAALLDCGSDEYNENIKIKTEAVYGQPVWWVSRGIGLPPNGGNYDAKWVTSPKTDDIKLNRWYHIVGTIAEDTLVLYVNGVELVRNVFGYNVEPTSTIRTKCYVGRANGGGGFFKGEIASIKMYSGAMSQAEVTTAFRALAWVYTYTEASTAFGNAIGSCSAYTHVAIDATAMSIISQAMKSCSNVVSVDITAATTVATIGADSFRDMTSLT